MLLSFFLPVRAFGADSMRTTSVVFLMLIPGERND